MKQVFGVILLVLALAVGIAGCSSSSNSQQASTTVEQQQLSSVEQAVENVRAGDNTGDALQNMAAAAQQSSGVSSATVSGNALTVTMTSGVTHVWDFSSDEQTEIRTVPVHRVAPHTRSTRQPVGTLLYLNPLSDVAHSGIPGFADQYHQFADDANLSFQEIDGTNVSVDQLKQLPQADIIVLITHGGNEKGTVNLATGETVNPISMAKHWVDLITGRVIIRTHYWASSNNSNTMTCYAITPSFITTYYGSHHLKAHSLFYTNACYGAANASMGNAFRAVGADAYLGWSDEGIYGAEYGELFFSYLLSGDTLRQDYNSAVSDGLTHYSFTNKGTTYDPELRAEPDDSTSWNWVLPSGYCTTAPTITITTPIDGTSQSGRTVTIQGTIDDTSITRGRIVVVHGNTNVPTPLDISNGSFSAQVGLWPGVNTVTVAATNAYGGTGNASVQINCTAPAQSLWSELTWDTNDTDVDLHLVRPGASLFDDIGDCYFGNKTPVWNDNSDANPVLDLDNTWGYGPEHITITEDPPAGTYALWAAYWRGDVPSGCMVFIATASSGIRQFGPFTLVNAGETSGDAYHICDITFPGGVITEPSRACGPIHVMIPNGIRKHPITKQIR